MEKFKNYTILYVEDDEGVRTINSRFLNRMFKKLYEAKDGEEGLALYKKYHPDIILTDIQMPKMDGITLSKKIRKTDKDTKIIISTAFSDKDYLLEAIELRLEKADFISFSCSKDIGIESIVLPLLFAIWFRTSTTCRFIGK